MTSEPTIERGEWLYNSEPDSESNPNPGEYHAYVVISDDYCKQQLGECLLNAAGDATAASQCNRENEDCGVGKIGEADTNVTWHEVEWMSLAKADLNGRAHGFGDVVPGMYIEAVNLDGSGHGLYIIEGKATSPTRCGFKVQPVHSTGHPNGKAVIKIFKMAEAANPEDYVRKSGDTMTKYVVNPSAPTKPAHAVNKDYIDALLDSLRGAEYEVRYTNGIPADGSSLVCIDDSSGQISAKSVLTFTAYPA